jgi:NTE family protein
VNARIVAVLSGGGAKAAAHVGAHRALEEHGWTPDHYVGTSMGAVMGACFAAGLRYDEMLRRVSAITRRDVASFSPRILLGPLGRSLLREGPFRETLEALVPARTFSSLAAPLTVTAVDAESGDLAVFGVGGRDQIPLIDALYASCALPMYYPPAQIGDREYIDGGVRSVFPLDLALNFEPDLVVGVLVGPSRFTPPAPSPLGARGMVAAHRRAMRIMMSVQTETLLRRWNGERPAPLVLINPQMSGGATFAVDRTVQFVEAGYRAAYQALQAWDGS